MINFTVITIFPPMFDSPLAHSILKKAQEKGLISVRLIDPRDYTADKHRTVDDAPYRSEERRVGKECRL